MVAFLRGLLRHLRGRVIVIWDGGSNHKGPAIREVLRTFPRLHLERLPGYAPDLNPVEMIWAYLKHGRLANFVPRHVAAPGRRGDGPPEGTEPRPGPDPVALVGLEAAIRRKEPTNLKVNTGQAHLPGPALRPRSGARLVRRPGPRPTRHWPQRRDPHASSATGQLRLLLYIPERSKQQGRRSPAESFEMATPIRFTRVSARLPEVIQ